MEINYKDIVPWGRSFDEYIKMFSLMPDDLNLKILDCGGGPSGFNAEMTRQGKKVISIDPIYNLSSDDIEIGINETYDDVINQTRLNADKFIWQNISSVEELGRIRMAAMKQFLDDFEQGKIEGRYIYTELPSLPFTDKEFDIALSSHFLFLYSSNLSLDFHRKAINEMVRVAREIRIFPLVNVNTIPSPYVEHIKNELVKKGYKVTIEKVDYEFQKGGNEILRIISK
ncbi:MAG: class I SAM-dependent methyltransferase [Methanosarcinales archaeon]|nr:class I SAM-dependent methyltransferase [Methanosarcinales archaeon]